MLLLEIPLEAIAVRYSAALAGSVWAWLAVVFAALGLWRIRSVGSPTKPDPKPEPPHKMPAPSAPPPAEKSKLPASSRKCHVADNGDCCAPKGRFTAYFHVVDGDGDEIEEESDGVSDVDREKTETLPLMKWEGTRWDLGWYRYVDLTALDGSVVRLWDHDGGLRRRV